MRLVPMVIETTGRGERAYDIFSRLLRDRIIFIGTELDDYVASLVIAQILFLQNEKKDQDIHMYINTPGGSVYAGLAIYDTMQYVQCDVATYCVGMAGSMGAVLLSAGTKGKRFALPNSRVLIHQPWGGMQGTATDVRIRADEMVNLREKINRILSKHTGRPMETIESDTERDKYMSAEEAKEYGIVDEILLPTDAE